MLGNHANQPGGGGEGRGDFLPTVLAYRTVPGTRGNGVFSQESALNDKHANSDPSS